MYKSVTSAAVVNNAVVVQSVYKADANVARDITNLEDIVAARVSCTKLHIISVLLYGKHFLLF